MIFGSRKSFALECNYLGQQGGQYYGNICIWVDGVSVGDLDEVSNLSDCMNDFSFRLQWKGDRKNRHLSSLSKEEAIDFVGGKLYSGIEQMENKAEEYSEEQSMLDWHLLERFLLIPNFPPFNGWLGLVIDEEGCQRILTLKYFRNSRDYREVIVNASSYEDRISEFLEWMRACD